MERRKEQVKAELAEIDSQIDKAFKEYRNHPYHLHSILIHDGDAESGHYYAFVFD
jgi:ubiquitin carboxyl-terminal hydrolase 25/28